MRVPPSVLLLRLATLIALGFTAATAVEYYGGGHAFCEPGGGCDLVKHSAVGRMIGLFLPGLGLIVFPLLFMGSLGDHRPNLKWVARLAVLIGLGGLTLLLLQALVIGHFCWLCVGVDVASMVGGLAGIWMLRQPVGRPDGDTTLASYAWPLVFLSLCPIAWALTFPDPELPDAIAELWSDDADVNIVEMADFECPYCRRMHPVLQEAVASTDGSVHLARIIMPLPFHPRARPAAAAYFCAEQLGHGEAMADALFTGELDDDAIAAHAAALGLEAEAFSACLDAEATDARIEQDVQRARDAGMAGLPMVYVGERAVVGFREDHGVTPYRQAIDAAMRGEGRRVRSAPFAILALLSLVTFALSARRLRG